MSKVDNSKFNNPSSSFYKNKIYDHFKLEVNLIFILNLKRDIKIHFMQVLGMKSGPIRLG